MTCKHACIYMQRQILEGKQQGTITPRMITYFPFLSVSIIILFFESCSCIKITWNW